MAKTPALLSEKDLEALRRLDTPTVCNAIEIVDPTRRSYGYTVETLISARPQLPSIVGYARTAIIRTRQPNARPPDDARAHRLAYLKYVADGPRPSIILIQDIDGSMGGFGCFWGEVHSTIHQSLGAVGAITDGGMRDVDALAAGFQILARKVVPSHAFDHLIDFDCEVNICGMVAQPGDLIHADRHGAVIVPAGAAAEIAAAAELIQRREAVLLAACRRDDFSYDVLVEAIAKADQIH